MSAFYGVLFVLPVAIIAAAVGLAARRRAGARLEPGGPGASTDAKV